MTMRVALLLALTFAATWPVSADIKFEGYGDVRLVLPSGDDDTWLEGGLSKTRFGRADGDGEFRVGEFVGEAMWQVAPDVFAFAGIRYDEDQRTPLDLIEAYVRYRPVSTNAWRWSVKAGAFFPPISFENDEIGWSSTWTLTPSAINTWVGEELRAIGAEAKVELRGSVDTLEVSGALLGWNDPAGVLIDVRGWALHDRPTGLFDDVRLPDAFVASLGGVPPWTSPMFKEIDGRVGYYARAAWKRESWRVEALRYDNRADPAAFDEQFAWRTEFWSAGAEARCDNVVVIAQALAGETELAPFPGFNRIVEFWSVFVLAGWERDQWRLAARAELFGADGTSHMGLDTHLNAVNYGEYGHAFTLAAAWLPEKWLRISAEALFIDSYRPQRRVTGLEADSAEALLQLGARVYF
jgi:hypothetical protein